MTNGLGATLGCQSKAPHGLLRRAETYSQQRLPFKQKTLGVLHDESFKLIVSFQSDTTNVRSQSDLLLQVLNRSVSVRMKVQ